MKHEGTFFHLLWTCNKVRKYRGQVCILIQKTLKVKVHLKHRGLSFMLKGQTNRDPLWNFLFMDDNGSKTYSIVEGFTNTYNGRMDGEAGRIGGDGKMDSLFFLDERLCFSTCKHKEKKSAQIC